MAAAFGEGAVTPAIATGDIETGNLQAADVQQWLRETKQANAEPAGIAALEQLLSALSRRDIPVPKETALLANYPNPFNPETWIPFRLRSSEPNTAGWARCPPVGAVSNRAYQMVPVGRGPIPVQAYNAPLTVVRGPVPRHASVCSLSESGVCNRSVRPKCL